MESDIPQMDLGGDQASFMTQMQPTSLNGTLEIYPRNLESRLDDGNFLVYLRLKPFDKPVACYGVENENTLTAVGTKPNASTHKFTFSSILPQSTTQEDTFQTCIQPLVGSFVKGNDCTVMTYGTTSAGKSFTMHGGEGNPGIIPRAIFTIFSTFRGRIEPSRYQPQSNSLLKILDDREIVKENWLKMKLIEARNLPPKTTQSFGIPTYAEMERNFNVDMGILDDCVTPCKVSVWISMIEVYNEQVIDLLTLPDGKKKLLSVSEDSNGNFYVKNAQQVNVHSGHEAFHICQIGRSNLHRAATALNDRSSRSHCVLFVSIIRLAENPSDMTVNRFAFVDLAGSERSKTTLNSGIRLNESSCINKSLATLGKCIRTMRENQSSRNQLPVPFRDSKLTKLFKNALCGSENLTFIVNISLDPILFGETLNVLKFSSLAQEVLPLASKKKTRFSQIVISGSYKLPEFAWASSQSDLSSMRENTFDATRLQRQLATAQSTIQDLRMELSIVQAKLIETEDSLEDAVAEKLAAIEKYNQEKVAAEALRERSGTMLSEIMTSKHTEVVSREVEITRLKEENRKLESDYDRLEDMYVKIRERLTRYKEKEKSNDEKIRQILEENGKLRKKNEKMASMLDEAAAEYQSLSTENAELREQASKLEADLEEQKRLEEGLRSELEHMKTPKGVESSKAMSPHSLAHAGNSQRSVIATDSSTNMTPFSVAHAGTNTRSVIATDSSTNMTPLSVAHAGTNTRSVIATDSGTNMTPLSVAHAGINTRSVIATDSSTNMTPLSVAHIGTNVTPPTVTEIGTNVTPHTAAHAGTSVTPQTANNDSQVTPRNVIKSSDDLIIFKSVKACQNTPETSRFEMISRWKGSKSQENLCSEEKESMIWKSKSIFLMEPANETLSGKRLNHETLSLSGAELDSCDLPECKDEEEHAEPPLEIDQKPFEQYQDNNTERIDKSLEFHEENKENLITERRRGRKKTKKNVSPENYPLPYRRMTRSCQRKMNKSKSHENVSVDVCKVRTPERSMFASAENLASCETQMSALKLKPEEGDCGKSTKKTKTVRKVGDPLDHPALSRTGRGKKKEENKSPEEAHRVAKKKLFSAVDDYIELGSDSDSTFVSPVKPLRQRNRKNKKT